MKSNSISSLILVGGLSLVLFFPLVVTDSIFFPFVVGRSLFSMIIVEILFLIWFFLFLKKKINLSGIFSPIFYSFSAFLTVVLLSDILGVAPMTSILSGYERMEGFILYFHLFLLFILASSLLSSTQLWRRILLISVGISALISTSEILKFFAGANSGRVGGPFGNPAFFAIYLLFHIFFIFLIAFRMWGEGELRKKYKFFGIFFLLIVEIFALYKTATRSSLIALVLGLFAAFFIWLVSRKSGKSKIITAVITVTAIVALFFSAFIFLKNSAPITSPTLSRFQQFTQSDISSNPRFLVWQVAWQGIKERPILGWGQENFPLVFEHFYSPKLSLQEPWFDRVHNSYLEWAVSAGLLGALAFTAFVVSPFFVLWRKREGEFTFPFDERVIFTGLLVAYLVNIFFVFDTLAGLVPLIFFLAYLSSQSSYGSFTPSLSLRVRIILASSAVLLVVFGVFFYSRVAVAGKSLLLAITPPEITQVHNRETLFKRALTLTPFDKGRVRQAITEFSLSVAHKEAIPEAEEMAIFELAKAELVRETEEHPDIVKNFIFLGNLLRTYGENEQAIANLSYATELSPSRKNIRKILGDMYVEEERFDEATMEYKALYELESFFDVNDQTYTFYIDNALADYVSALIRAGRKEEAEALLLARFGTKLWTRPEVINAYVLAGEYHTAVALWEMVAEEFPEDPQNLFSLAAAYAKVGQSAKAIQTLEDAVIRHPSVKDTAQYYIGLIRVTGALPIQ